MIAFLFTALFIGFTVTYVLPKANGWLAKVPGSGRVVNNKFAQLLIVGAVVLIGLHIFLAIARKVE